MSSLPRQDLSKHIMIGFMGTRSVYKVVKEMARRLGPLSMNPKHVFMWLSFLKKVENPYYVNVDIPDTEEKIKIAATILLEDTNELLDAGDVCNSATLLNLDNAQRSELELVWMTRLLQIEYVWTLFYSHKFIQLRIR